MSKADFMDIKPADLVCKLQRKVLEETQTAVSNSEVESWYLTIEALRYLFRETDIPDNITVEMEYKVPLTHKRIDVLLTGYNSNGEGQGIIIEMKGWSQLKNDKIHPCYQAESYKRLLEEYNTEVTNKNVSLKAFAYLPNARILNNGRTCADAPQTILYTGSYTHSFGKRIGELLRKGDDGKVMTGLAHAGIKPSPSLIKEIVCIVNNDSRFVLVAEQYKALETIRKTLQQSLSDGQKRYLLVNGAPGTGKSVVAVHALAKAISQEWDSVRAIYACPQHNTPIRWLLRDELRNESMSPINLFTDFRDVVKWDEPIDLMLVDEAHRDETGDLSQVFSKTLVTVFFYDENQITTCRTLFNESYLQDIAEDNNVLPAGMIELRSQFRCGGTSCYVDWVKKVLLNNEPAMLDTQRYPFVVCDNMQEVTEHIRQHQQHNEYARIVSGHCWEDYCGNRRDGTPIPPKPDGLKLTNAMPNHWASCDEYQLEVGLPHFCAGLEFDYVGVYLGPDIFLQEGNIIWVNSNRRLLSYDSDVSDSTELFDFYGISGLTTQEYVFYLKNAYYLLLTRGIKGCYVYIEDIRLRQYIRSLLK